MWNAIKLLLASRKAVLAVLAAVSWLAAHKGWGFSPEAALAMISPFIAVIFGIAYEDGAEKSAAAPADDDEDAPA